LEFEVEETRNSKLTPTEIVVKWHRACVTGRSWNTEKLGTISGNEASLFVRRGCSVFHIREDTVNQALTFRFQAAWIPWYSDLLSSRTDSAMEMANKCPVFKETITQILHTHYIQLEFLYKQKR
jgi:hypothetical protein